MHKSETPDAVARRYVAGAMMFEDPNIRKARANRKWYELHKLWKKEYNKKYYAQNKAYWQDRYSKELVLGNNHFPSEYEMSDPKLERQLNKNTRQQIQKDAEDRIRGGLWSVADAQGYAQTQLINLKAAEAMNKYYTQAYQHYMDNHKKMKVTEAWSDGAKMIRDTGKSFLSKFGLKL